MNKRGFFLAIEGPDGSGKSTIAKHLEELLKNKNIDYVITREPGCNDVSVCKSIRSLLLENSEMSAKTEALLFAANRSEHIEKLIKPSIKNNKFIICDRYVDSSIAYQGFGRDLGYRDVLTINNFATDELRPDLVIFIDINPEEAMKRIINHRQHEVNRLDNEKIDFHKKVYEGYKYIIKKNKKEYKIIDGQKLIDEILEEVIKNINERLKSGEFFIDEI